MVLGLLWYLACNGDGVQEKPDADSSYDSGLESSSSSNSDLSEPSDPLPPAAAPTLSRDFFCVEPVALPLADWFAHVEDLGVGTVGVNEVNWDFFEPQEPIDGEAQYDPQAWSLMGEVLTFAEQADLRLQLTLQVRSPWGTASVESGAGAPGSSPVLPEHQGAFERFLGDLLSPLGNHEPGAVVMVGNELEAPGHWNGSEEVPADAEAYAELVEGIARVRDAVAPEVALWRGSSNLAYIFDDNPDEDEVAERLALLFDTEGAALFEDALRGELAVDAFSIHPNYAPEGLWHQSQWLRGNLPAGYPIVAEDMRSVRVDGLPETTWPDEDGDGEADIFDALAAGDSQAEAEWAHAQVATLSQKLILAAAAGLEVACVSTLVDFPESYALASWRYAGLVKATGERRPAFNAYALWIDALNGWTPHTPLEIGEEGRWVVPFSRGEERALAAWGDGEWQPPTGWGDVQEALQPPSQDAQEGWQIQDSATLTLSELPLWVILDS